MSIIVFISGISFEFICLMGTFAFIIVPIIMTVTYFVLKLI